MALAIPARLLISASALSAIAIACASTPALAQNKLARQSAAVTVANSATPAAADPGKSIPDEGLPPVRIGNVVVTGSVQTDAFKVNDDQDDQFRDGFRVRRARIGLVGTLTPRVTFNLSGELTDSAVLRNAFVDVRIAKALSVRMGQATPLQGIERGTSQVALAFIDRTRITAELTYPQEPGISIFNATPLRGWLSYAVSLVNGAGMNRRDDNDAKDVIGRVEVIVPRLRRLSMVAVAASGRQPLGQRTRHTVGAQYESRAFTLTTEALRERSEDATAREGFYASGVYRVRPRRPRPNFRMVELVARYSFFDDPLVHGAGTGALPAHTREIQAGGNYYVNRNVRFMLNTIVPVSGRGNPGSTLIARAQVIF